MAYTVDYTDGTKTAITVANGSVNTATNIGLVGQGYENYGEVIAEDLLHILENFASGTSPNKPIEGQLWYDSNNNQLNYFDDTISNSGNWKPVASMSVQANAPTSVGETDGHFWLDSDTGLLYLYYSGSWLNISDVAGATRFLARQRNGVVNDATAPNNGQQLIFNTLETIVNNEIVTIFSSYEFEWTPVGIAPDSEYLEDGITLLSSEFPLLKQGVTLNASQNYVFHGTATSALYADLAERYHADAVYEYGTVVRIGGSKEITATTKEYCEEVFGIVSDKPAFAMNSGAGDSKTHPYVALSGRVPVRVVGKVNKGDRLVSSNVAGHAMAGGAGLNWQYVIGRALEDKINEEPGIIEAVVGTK